MALRAISLFAVVLSAVAVTLVILIAIEEGDTVARDGEEVSRRISYSWSGVAMKESNTMDIEVFREVLKNNGSLQVFVYSANSTLIKYDIREPDIPTSAAVLRKIVFSETPMSPTFVFGKPTPSPMIEFTVVRPITPTSPQQDNTYLSVTLIGFSIVMMTFSVVAFCSASSKSGSSSLKSQDNSESHQVRNEKNENRDQRDDGVREKKSVHHQVKDNDVQHKPQIVAPPRTVLTHSKLRGVSPPYDKETELKTCESCSISSEPDLTEQQIPPAYKSCGPRITDTDFDKLSHLASLRASGADGLKKENWEKIQDYSLTCGSTVSLFRRKLADSSLNEYLTFGELHCSAPQFFMLNNDVKYRKTWDKYCLDLKVIESYDGIRDCSLYWKVKFPSFLTNRDYVFFREHRIHKGKIYSISKSGSHGDYPPSKNAVRVIDFYNNCLLENSPKGPGWCLYTSLYFDDPRMVVPASIMNWLTASAVPQFIENMIQIGQKYEPKDSPDLKTLVEVFD